MFKKIKCEKYRLLVSGEWKCLVNFEIIHFLSSVVYRNKLENTT